MAQKFKVSDPKGRDIVCSDDCWDEHILDQRPWMSTYLSKVQKAITDPTFIVKDANFENRQNYYLLNKTNSHYMKVVVEFVGNDGTVITAFISDKIIETNIVWSKPSA